MRIDGTFGYEAHGLAGNNRASGQRAPKPAARIEGDAAVEVAASARKYIDKALAAEEVDPAAIAEAKRLLAEGLLDTPEAIERAADAMVMRGL